MKIKALQERLDYWQTKLPGLFVESFKNGDRDPFLATIYTIMVADNTPGVSWLDKEVLESFVDELVKPFSTDIQGFKKCVKESNPEIIKPVIDLIKRHRDKIIDAEVSGIAVISENGITEQITRDEVIRHSVRINKILMTKNDVVEVYKDLINYKKSFFNGSTKVQNTVPESRNKLGQPSLSEYDPNKLISELDEIRSSENLLWKGLPMNKVISHFTVMTTTKNKNGEVFLTTQQLISFLRKGFLNDTTQPKQKFNCSNGEKGFVIKRFYELFDIAVSQYGHIQKKGIFIKLFTNCFDNWEEKSIPSFFKPGKTISKW